MNNENPNLNNGNNNFSPTMVDPNTLQPNIPTSPNPGIDPTLPNTNQIDRNTVNPNLRYNPVTGEEVDIRDITGVPVDNTNSGNDRIKNAEANYKPTSTWNTILLIFFFLFLIFFVIFLPEIEMTINELKNGGVQNENPVITTGRLVCTSEDNTKDFDRSLERIFTFQDNLLKTGTLITTIKGDISLDEELLSKYHDECVQIRTNVEDLEGISVSCSLDNSTLEIKEVFDYATYDAEKVSDAYLEAGSNMLEFEYDQNIDRVMTLMRQGGFTCNKEK